MPLNGGREELERARSRSSSAEADDAPDPAAAPPLEGPPPRDVILLDSISVGPGQVVDILVPRDRSVPAPDELIDPFDPADRDPDRDPESPAELSPDRAPPLGPAPGPPRPRLVDLWRRLLRLFRASSRS